MLGSTVGDIKKKKKKILVTLLSSPFCFAKRKKKEWNYKISQLKLLKENQVSLRLTITEVYETNKNQLISERIRILDV